jgi:hypothetical protein
MKLALLTSALVAVIAGTASASLFLDTAQPGRASAVSLVVPSPQPSDVPKPHPKPAFEVRQAPVPSLRVSQRTSARRAARTEETDRARAATAADASATGEDAARAAILADGYRSVRALARKADGRWTAQAMRGDTEIGVTVDAGGRVSID